MGHRRNNRLKFFAEQKNSMLNVECGMSNSDLLTYKLDMLISKTIVKVVQQLKARLLVKKVSGN